MHRTHALVSGPVSLGSSTTIVAVSVAVTFLGSFAMLAGGCTWSPPPNIGSATDTGPGSGAGGERNPGVGGMGVTVDSGPSTPTTDANCGSSRNPTSRLDPDLLLIFDRSGSMAADPATGRNCTPAATCPSKWNQATAAVNMAVASSQAMIRWGLKLFSSTGNGCGVTPGAQVGIGLNTAPAIAAALGGAGPAGSTPTTMAMTLGGDYLATLTTPNPRFIVLVTDGQPTCAGGNGNGDDSPAAIAAVAAQAARGYGTFVIGVATANDAMATATLTSMSTAGMHPRPGTPNYYVVNNTAELVTALGAIGTQVASCTFTLANAPPDPANVVVLADGKPVPKDMLPTDDGWTYGAGMTSVTLTGTYCQDVLNSVVQNVEVLFGCNGITPTIP
jgi:hypothetical protein